MDAPYNAAPDLIHAVALARDEFLWSIEDVEERVTAYVDIFLTLLSLSTLPRGEQAEVVALLDTRFSEGEVVSVDGGKDAAIEAYRL